MIEEHYNSGTHKRACKYSVKHIPLFSNNFQTFFYKSEGNNHPFLSSFFFNILFLKDT